MADQEALLLFDPPSATFAASVTAPAPLVIDSFLVDDGRVRALERHVRRFAASCATLRGVDEETVATFAIASVRQIPLTGQWFPRFELLDDNDRPCLALRVRRAPARRLTATVWLGAGEVPRVAPTVKGPDLGVLSDLRRDARRTGADEALLSDAAGHALETSQSSLIWWRGDVLCCVPDDVAALPGITRQLLIELAEGTGQRVERELVRPVELDGLEGWMVNALHGLRVVTGWVGGDAPIRPPVTTRAESWRAALHEQHWAPLRDLE
jgi:branched-subunit amino acid aminotransferase/4-amino-4-deoxychorismate lyase